MTESVRRLKANKVMDGKLCLACRTVVLFGNDAAVCTACQSLHHASCWDEKAGCAREGCVNAPLRQMAAPAPVAAPVVPLGKVQCPHCQHIYSSTRGICPKCKRAPTASGVYTGPKQNHPEASKALVFGILSFIICAPIFGPMAISKANTAIRAIDADPRLGGRGMATAGKVCGIIGLCLFGLFLLLRFANE